MRNFLISCTALCLAPGSGAQAHPHLFVGVDVTMIYENGSPTGIKLEWAYDEFFSLLLTTDLGIDLDGDLVLSPDEIETLAASVADWPEDFGGDLEVTQVGNDVALGERTQHTMTYSEGLIRETHVRPILAGTNTSDPLVVRVYDPFYYISYSLNGAVTFEGIDTCAAAITAPDLNAAYSLVEELLYGRAASDVGADEEFPKVGIEFAETITISCAH